MENTFQYKVYNHAILLDQPPHDQAAAPDAKRIRTVMRENKALLTRWTSEYDCGTETEWWYIIKDDELNLESLKSKRKYEIKQGLKQTDVKKLDSKGLAIQMYDIYQKATGQYKSFHTDLSEETFITQCEKNFAGTAIEYYGVFIKNTEKMIGYAVIADKQQYADFMTLKLDPEYLKYHGSASLVYYIVTEYLNRRKKRYICDGERSVRHKTNFQDYLIKYFGFRKAFCKLNIVYRPFIRATVAILYPLRSLIRHFDKYSFINNISAILEMERIRRSF